ncbi:unnamed protein product, partial [Heterotrigona itama]
CGKNSWLAERASSNIRHYDEEGSIDLRIDARRFLYCEISSIGLGFRGTIF